MNRVFRMTAGVAWLIVGVVNAQELSQRQTEPSAAEKLVIVPNDQAMAAKQRLLDKIAKVGGDDQRPVNVVLILADDLGYADTSTYGSKTIPTPHIDALAAGGVRFTDAYVTAATCSPSRAGLMSGRYQQRFGFEFNTSGGAITYRESRGLDPAVVTLADVFHQAGYATGMFGKWHLGSREYFHPQQRGFDEFFGFLAGAHSFFPVDGQERFFSTVMRGKISLKEPAYLTDAFAREAVKFIDAHKEKPFFLYVPFNAVHTPIEASDNYLKRFPEVTNRRQRAYNAMTSALDDAVGSIVKAVKANGIDRNTLIIFLNDNGGPIYTRVQSNGRLRLGKLFLFEGGVRVPMIVNWPGMLEPGKIYRQPVSSLDVFPTACAAAAKAGAYRLGVKRLMVVLDMKSDAAKLSNAPAPKWRSC
ncbi:MAG: sulfatase-like hydrolase/transferase [Planctomycetes bacterium]|nr:sulfatase-like hydrolase/transferase [Planctomycetota bacterium]